MRLNPHLTFNGQCEAAFKYYEKCLNDKIVMMMTYGDSPMAEQTPVDFRKKVIHATFALGEYLLQGADVPRSAIKNRRAFP